MRAVLSYDAVTMRRPVGREGGGIDGSAVARSATAICAAGRGIPDARGLVVRRGDEPLPSGENAADSTKSGSLKSSDWRPVAASQMRAVLSCDAVTMRRTVRREGAQFAPNPCARSAAPIAGRFAASQMRAVLSYDAVSTRRPSGENAADSHGRCARSRACDLPAGRCIPDARGLVVRRRDDAPAIGREQRRSNVWCARQRP